jgi:hypothetical protein
VTGGNKSETGAGLLESETGVRTSVQMSGDGVVLRAKMRSLVAMLVEERPDKY